jgi:predicted RNA binding protein YcfA (HicA-like mRNA interferase family)
MKLPVMSGLEAIKKLKRAGFIATRQKGSHVRLEKSASQEILKVTVPLHPELKKGTLARNPHPHAVFFGLYSDT